MSISHSLLPVHLVGVAPGIQDLVKKVEANPKCLGYKSSIFFSVSFIFHILTSYCVSAITYFMVDCLISIYQAEPTAQDGTKLPTSPALSDTKTPQSELSSNLDVLTIIAPDMVSKYKMHFYYYGVRDLQLIWCSDTKTNPFPILKPGTCFFKILTKTAHGIFSMKLNEVWDCQTVFIVLFQLLIFNSFTLVSLHSLPFMTYDTHQEQNKTISSTACVNTRPSS